MGKGQFFKVILPYLDILAIWGLGILLMRYWVTGQLQLLIHPNYFGLVLATSLVLLTLTAIRIGQLLQRLIKRSRKPSREVQHLTLFPPGFSNFLLVSVAVLGLSIAPKVFSSQIALQRGVTESLAVTRIQPQSFRASLAPEDRTLIDWIRTLNAYPEPDSYQGQPIKVTGFSIHPPDLPQQYFLISRFVLTCCAVDAYPVGLPVKLPDSSSRDDYAPDIWLEVEGTMTTEELSGVRRLTILPDSLTPIPTPDNPYEY